MPPPGTIIRTRKVFVIELKAENVSFVSLGHYRIRGSLNTIPSWNQNLPLSCRAPDRYRLYRLFSPFEKPNSSLYNQTLLNCYDYFSIDPSFIQRGTSLFNVIESILCSIHRLDFSVAYKMENVVNYRLCWVIAEKASKVNPILTNEKYKGCALLQKGYTADFLSKKRKINKGEIQQFYIEEHHNEIIPPATFDLVQLEMQKRRDNGHSGLSIFSSKIKCGECGEWYGSKVWHSTDKYRRVVYRCNRKYQGDHRCGTPHLTEEGIKKLFLKALNTLVSEKEEVIANLEMLLSTDTSPVYEEKEALKQDVEEIEKNLRRIVTEKAHATQDLSSYDAQYEALYPVYEQKQARKAEIESEIKARKALSEQLRAFIGELMDMSCEQTSFDELLWCGIVDHVTVYSQDRIVFCFVGGIEVMVPAG